MDPDFSEASVRSQKPRTFSQFGKHNQRFHLQCIQFQVALIWNWFSHPCSRGIEISHRTNTGLLSAQGMKLWRLRTSRKRMYELSLLRSAKSIERQASVKFSSIGCCSVAMRQSSQATKLWFVTGTVVSLLIISVLLVAMRLSSPLSPISTMRVITSQRFRSYWNAPRTSQTFLFLEGTSLNSGLWFH